MNQYCQHQLEDRLYSGDEKIIFLLLIILYEIKQKCSNIDGGTF